MLIPLASFVILWPLLLGGAAPTVHVARSPGLQDPSGSVPAPARPAALPIGGVDWEVRLYRNLQGRELQEVGKQHVRLQPADVVGWHDLDVRIRGKDVTIALGSRALLEYRADEAVAGKFGIYVSGATEALDPFVIRNFHVEGAGR